MSDRFDELDDAISEGNKAPFEELSTGTDVVELTNGLGTTLLNVAVRREEHEIAELLLKAGADPDNQGEGLQRNRYGYTSLHRAAKDADAEMVELLLEYGADVDARDASGLTALHHAPINYHDDEIEAIVGLLIDAGADPDARTDEGKQAALHNAAFEGSVEATWALLEGGASPDPRSSIGVSPIHLAAANGAGPGMNDTYIRIIELLFEDGADPTAETTDDFRSWETKHPAGSTPVEMAERHGHESIVSYLRDLMVELS